MSVTEDNTSRPSQQAYVLHVDKIPGPDFTVYWTDQDFLEVMGMAAPRRGEDYVRQARSLSLNITRPKHPTIHARGHLCSAYGGTNWSLTLRCDEQSDREAKDNYDELVKDALEEYSIEHQSSKGKVKEYLGYFPVGDPSYANPSLAKANENKLGKPTENEDIFLNDIYCLCKHLYNILLPKPNAPPSGLIVVTGATDSSKSLLTRGLIFLFLQAAAKRALKNKLRRPHLVTFEDPVEQYYIKDPRTHAAPDTKNLITLLEALYLDYTPRERGVDAASLREVIRDALRQTPAMLFVGETRKKRDWNELLEFAGSGHLVVTTSHAGSVVEAMSRIFKDTSTSTAAQRSEVTRRILGVINIRSYALPIGYDSTASGQQSKTAIPERNIRALLPALWRRTPQSINSLTADGLAALVPALGEKVESGYYSRTYFINKLIKEMTNRIAGSQREGLRKKLVRQAREWDLEGG